MDIFLSTDFKLACLLSEWSLNDLNLEPSLTKSRRKNFLERTLFIKFSLKEKKLCCLLRNR